MRGAVLVVGLLVEGCFAPHPAGGLPCSSRGDCPDGQMCSSRGLCEPEPTGDAAGDTSNADADPDPDKDGIMGAADNCPTIANQNQHDEDGDKRGDACDGCPHVAQTTFDNGDGDGVDDACDPNPATPGDTIAKFYAFDVDSNDFTKLGNWTVANDRISVTNANANLLIAGTHTKVTAEMGGTIDAISSNSREIKLVAGRTANNSYTSCCFDDTDGGAPKYVYEIEDEAPTGTTVLVEPARAKMAVGPFVIRLTSKPGSNPGMVCAGSENGVMRAATAAAPGIDPGQIQVFLRNTSISLDYLIIIDSP